MQSILTTLTVRSIRSIKLELQVASNPANPLKLDNVKELIVRRSYEQDTDVNGYMLLREADLKDCLQLVSRLKVSTLYFRKVHFGSIEDKLDFSKCKSLNTINFKHCDRIFSFVREAVRSCPYLQNIRIVSSVGVTQTNDRFWFTVLIKELILMVKTNYWLRSFTIDDLDVRVSWFETFMAQPRGFAKRQEMIDVFAELNGLLTRNIKGHRRCFAAIRQLFLIKKYRSKSVFGIIGIDVVKIIVRMLHSSLGTAIWC